MTAPRDARLEALMDDHGIDWRLTTVPTADIDITASRANQYRLTPVDPGTVDRYTDDLRRGDRFPPIVVRQPRTRLVIVGGIHRYHAHRNVGHDHIDAYLIDCTAAQARRLSFEDNRTHGLTLKANERALLAARMVELDGVTQQDAAATVGISDFSVAVAVNARKADERADQAGVPDFDRLAMAVRYHLGRLPHDLFAEVAPLVVANRASTNRVIPLVKRLLATDDPAEQADILDETEAAWHGTARHGHRARDQRAKLIDAIFGALDQDPATVAAQTPAGADAEQLDEWLRRCARHLMDISKLLAVDMPVKRGG